MNWRNDNITKKQKEVLKAWGYKRTEIPKTKGEASDLIGKAKDLLHLKCKTCRKSQHLVIEGKTEVTIKCCGHSDTYYSPNSNKYKKRTARRMDEIIFEMTTGMTIEQASRIHFGDDDDDVDESF